MSFIGIFAGIVLLVFVATAVAVASGMVSLANLAAIHLTCRMP